MNSTLTGILVVLGAVLALAGSAGLLTLNSFLIDVFMFVTTPVTPVIEHPRLRRRRRKVACHPGLDPGSTVALQ
jgi:hypothetical protein